MICPRIHIYLDRIRQNARAVTSLLNDYQIACFGVTKVMCGEPTVARALLEGGCVGLADSRIANLKKLKEAGIDAPMMLLRLPMISQSTEVVLFSDISLVTEIKTARALGEIAQSYSKEHHIILMIDIGDLREGIWPPEKAIDVALELDKIEGIYLAGVGANFACYGGIIPDEESMDLLVSIADHISASLGRRLNILSGGNSSGLPLVSSGKMSQKINSLRVGETIILGRNVIDRSPFPGTRQDTIEIIAEIIELQVKPSHPIGMRGEDAFGHCKDFIDKGLRKRAILALGRQDIIPEHLTPALKGVQIVGGSSDHLIVDITDREDNDQDTNIKVGSQLSFYPDYSALLTAMTSPYVNKELVCDSLSYASHDFQ